MHRDNLLIRLKLTHEVNLPSGRATKREGCFAFVVGYRKVPEAKNVHPNDDIKILMENHLGDPYHGKHDPIRETNVN